MARRELVSLADEMNCSFMYEGRIKDGKDFAVCVGIDGLTWGAKDAEGFCELEEYGQDGELLYGWGGDGLDLLAEVRR